MFVSMKWNSLLFKEKVEVEFKNILRTVFDVETNSKDKHTQLNNIKTDAYSTSQYAFVIWHIYSTNLEVKKNVVFFCSFMTDFKLQRNYKNYALMNMKKLLLWKITVK